LVLSFKSHNWIELKAISRLNEALGMLGLGWQRKKE